MLTDPSIGTVTLSLPEAIERISTALEKTDTTHTSVFAVVREDRWEPARSRIDAFTSSVVAGLTTSFLTGRFDTG
ncbi:hypothetical protein ACDF64_03170 [Agromyces sp. MMS24-JH15]|uniref:hypothetical protein n=1 Tax=Agromyces sp. MMS24-JH15 TaxID=3243765 RepID=UPI003748B070